jgi:hypothetical protein
MYTCPSAEAEFRKRFTAGTEKNVAVQLIFTVEKAYAYSIGRWVRSRSGRDTVLEKRKIPTPTGD